MSEVSWRHDGRRLLLPVLILPPAIHDLRVHEAHALIDTGATTSAITGDIAEALELPVIGKRNVMSAHADEMVERYVFRGGLPLSGSNAPAFPFLFEEVEGFRIRRGFSFDALIGMDILAQCDLLMGRGGRCTLRFG